MTKIGSIVTSQIQRVSANGGQKSGKAFSNMKMNDIKLSDVFTPQTPKLPQESKKALQESYIKDVLGYFKPENIQKKSV